MRAKEAPDERTADTPHRVPCDFLGLEHVPICEPQAPTVLEGSEELTLCEHPMLDIWLVTVRVTLGKGEWKWRVEAETHREALQVIKDSGYFCGQAINRFVFAAQRAAYVESDRLAIVLAEPAEIQALESGADDQAAAAQVMQGSAA